VVTFSITVEGGSGEYTYYRDIEQLYGPTQETSFLYDLEWGAGSAASGTFVVTSGGDRAESKFYESHPVCVTSTPTFTPAPTSTPTLTSTLTPTATPTPTVTPTPDTAGPTIDLISIDTEVTPGVSIDGNQDLTVRYRVVDPSGIREVTLHYEFEDMYGDRYGQQPLQMTKAGNDEYQATIDSLSGEVLYFWIVARDMADPPQGGNETRTDEHRRFIEY
jgi:hypothetical protein